MSDQNDVMSALFSARLRGQAIGTLVTGVMLIPVYILWFGLPVLWRDWPREMRRAWLTLLRGKRGPYPGIVW